MTGYEARFNVNSLNTTVVSNTTTGTIHIPFALVINGTRFGADFLQGFVNGFVSFEFIRGVPGLEFGESGASLFIETRSQVSEIVNDTTHGPTFIIRSEVIYNYDFSMPLTSPRLINIQIRVGVSGDINTPIPFERNPLIRGDTLEIIPPGIINIIKKKHCGASLSSCDYKYRLGCQLSQYSIHSYPLTTAGRCKAAIEVAA